MWWDPYEFIIVTQGQLPHWQNEELLLLLFNLYQFIFHLLWYCHINLSEIIQIDAWNNYEGYQHTTFIFSQKSFQHLKAYLMTRLTWGYDIGLIKTKNQTCTFSCFGSTLVLEPWNMKTLSYHFSFGFTSSFSSLFNLNWLTWVDNCDECIRNQGFFLGG